ncbi:uncharacterized protein FFB20_12765 [Fusarium fujikuroi]|nr:uncharacterized protein FFC1_09349 [Fusarium fujikuroi]SCO07064.1 uncharacterized protein FFB20_12765 [Fusarium fujikuroi]SCO22044.1 uncharacterized protein FFE2_15122 [Fusarium fujikuroi]SCO35608.1 uncharacterized protein FFNC_04624 [Fusarium fujikuroi]SCV49972.1 uncharacterized protein FFFS_09277 [Fusarium fujikuroi]
MEDWPHFASSVHNGEARMFELPTDEEHVDEICAKKSKHVVLGFTTMDIETVPESSTETIEAIGYQEEWEKDVELWFRRNNYEPIGHRILDSNSFSGCYQGLERFAAYGRLDHDKYAWHMRMELENSTATLHR